MTISENIQTLSVNIQSLSKSIDELTEKISAVVIPAVPSGLVNKTVDENTPSSPLNQDIQIQVQRVYDLNCKLLDLMNRINIA